ncbi:MAG: hypothetical protein AB1916_07030 [Thermodesulfobacteriota bacterium]
MQRWNIPRKYSITLVAIVAIFMIVATVNITYCENSARKVSRKVYTEGCGGCHMPYPPQLLPARSWERILDGLADHFGTPVELTASQRDDIRKHLVAGAGTGKMKKENSLRITETGWFKYEHNELRNRNSSPNMADCQSCHPDAIKGKFEDD